MPISLNAVNTELGQKAELPDFSVTTNTNGSAALAYDNSTGVFAFTPTLKLTDLGITDGSSGQYLRTDGAGNFVFAANGLPSLDALSVTTATAANPSSLVYDDLTGVFTYTPEDVSTFVALTDFQVLTAAASGGGALAYDNTTGDITFTPPDLSTYIDLTSISVTQNAASGTGTLSYDNSTGVFTYTPPNIPVVNTPNKYMNVNGSTSTFTIQANHTINTCLVFYNGVCLVPTDDYTVSGTTLTTTFTPVAGSDIVIRYLPN